MAARYGKYSFDTSSIAGSTDTLAAATGISDSSITLTSGTATVSGTQIQIDSERMLILSGGGTATLQVLRGFGGTTAAAHANGATVSVPGALTYDLLQLATVPNQQFTMHKASSDINYVNLVPFAGDSFPGGASSIILADDSMNYGTVVIQALGIGSKWLVVSGAGIGTSGAITDIATAAAALVSAPTTPGNPTLLSVSVVDATPDASGNPQKLITVVYAPPFPIGTFTGMDVYLDAPDTSGGLYIADGTMPADGTIAALGVFNPKFITFVGRNIAHPSNQFSFVTAAPTALQLWRLYVTPASQNIKVIPTQYGFAGASPSLQFAVPPPASGGSGVEYAPLIQNFAMASLPTGWTSNPDIEISDSGDQSFQHAESWTWPTNDPNFAKLGGVNFVLQNNGNGSQSYLGDVQVSAAGLALWPTKTVLPGTTLYTLYALSFDVNGKSNTLVPGVTPSVTFSVSRRSGIAGEEFCHLVTSDGVHAFVVVTPVNGADGTQLLQVDGYWANLSQGQTGYDPQFGGAEIVVDKADGHGPIWSVTKGTLSPIEHNISQPAAVATWTFYLRSIDINGRGNSIVPGLTPSVAISVGNASGVLNLGKAAASSFSPQFSIISGAFTATAINANVITTGTLQVGADGIGKPIELEVFDHFGSLIGWIGDDTFNSGYVGAWFKQMRIGGSSPSNAPLVADSSGNVTINGATFTLNLNGVTTTLNSALNSALGIYVGLEVLNTSAGNFSAVDPNGFYVDNSSGQIVCSMIRNPAGNGIVNAIDNSTGEFVRMDSSVPGLVIGSGFGQTIVKGRQTGPGSPSGFADATAQAWCLALYNALSAASGHGLID